jgi:signal transduction histidine kinase/ligand-binding sensor domain-containing protein
MSVSAIIKSASKLATRAKPIASTWARWMLLFLFATSLVLAQSHTLEVSQYLHTSWTSQEGTLKGIIHSVAQTSDGYVWLASGTGTLFRFDGVRFSEWKPPANASLPGKPLHNLLGSKDGSLWIGGIGLAEIKANGEFHTYHEFDGADIDGGLLEDKDGGIWAGGKGSKVCRIYRGKTDCLSADISRGVWIGAMHEDYNGQVWVCSKSGIWRIRSGLPQNLAPMPKEITGVYAFEQDASGALIFATAGNIRMVTAEGKVSDYSIDVNGARALLKDREGDLWVGTNGKGIVHIHEGRTDRFTISDGLSSNSVIDIVQDREGNVWAGTSRGLDKFTKPAVPSITSKQGLTIDYVNSVVTDREGVSWVGSHGGGLYKLDNGGVLKSTSKLPSDAVTSLFKTDKGRILVATDDPRGLAWLDQGKVSRLRAATGENIFDIEQDNRGDLWVLSRELGLLHLREDGSVLDTFQAKIGGTAFALDPIHNGLWLTTSRGVLAFFKDGKVTKLYGPKDGLGEGIIRDPHVDSEGGVWASTRVGLAHLANGKISVLGRKNGLPCDAVHWMRHDRDHNIWLYMECGLVALSENDLSAWIADSSHTVAIVHYLDNTEGVENVAYNGWYTPQAATTSDGRILFATTIGLSILDPRNLNQNALPPPVHIEEITADERQVRVEGRVPLPVGVRTIQIGFTALSFANPRRVLFRHRLQGYDKDWSSPGPLRQTTYTNLPPGSYEFRVIACNNDGVWNATGDTLSFLIPPVFYQTPWFRCLLVAAVACLLWILYALRLKKATAEVSARLGERLQERERIARELHDTLLQDFQAVILRFQLVTNRLAKADPNRVAMDSGLDFADKVLAEGRNQIRDIRADTQAMDELSKSLAAYGEELTQLWPRSFHLTVIGTQFELYPELRDDIYRIGREALGNAFKHSNGSAVEMEIGYLAAEFRMRVSDDGDGIDPHVAEKGRSGHWGIGNMQERARKIRGILKILSRPNNGTSVELTIPLEFASEKNGSWFPWGFKKQRRSRLVFGPWRIRWIGRNRTK